MKQGPTTSGGGGQETRAGTMQRGGGQDDEPPWANAATTTTPRGCHDVTARARGMGHHEPMACRVGCTKAPYPHSVARLNGALSVVPSFVTVPMRNLLMLFLSR